MVKAATKTCSTCHACKPVALFYKKRNQCQACRAAKNREYRQGHTEKIAAYERKWRQQNKNKISARSREYYQNNKVEIAAKKCEYYQNNKVEIGAKRREYKVEYYQANKAKVIAQQREYQRGRYHSDPTYAIKSRLRARMRHAVKAAGLDKKCASSSELLGISPQGLKEWLESQFTEGMTWENRSDWHVDHIIPCTAFDLTVDENQRICFWYKNLQPMWAKENLQKSNTYTEAEKQALISAYCNQLCMFYDD